MRNGQMKVVRSLVMVGFGAALSSAGVGCATAGAGSAVMTPAEAEQVASEECVGVPAKEREEGLLAYRDSIAGTRPLKEDVQVGKVKFSHERGVVISLRARQGMSAPWLGRVSACHIALVAAAGGQASGAANDPLLVPGVTVRVEEAYDGFVVSVRVPDDAAATETLRRAQALLTGPSGPATAQK
jgi:hypothetical protein